MLTYIDFDVIFYETYFHHLLNQKPKVMIVNPTDPYSICQDLAEKAEYWRKIFSKNTDIYSIFDLNTLRISSDNSRAYIVHKTKQIINCYQCDGKKLVRLYTLYDFPFTTQIRDMYVIYAYEEDYLVLTTHANDITKIWCYYKPDPYKNDKFALVEVISCAGYTNNVHFSVVDGKYYLGTRDISLRYNYVLLPCPNKDDGTCDYCI